MRSVVAGVCVAVAALAAGTHAQTMTLIPGFRAQGVSADGRVVVGYRVNSEWAGVWRRETGLVLVPVPGAIARTRADAVSDDGSTVVGTVFSSHSFPLRAWVWRGQSDFSFFEYAGGNSTRATCVSGDGRVVGGIVVLPPANHYQSIVWTADEGLRLVPPGENYATWLHALSTDGLRGVGSGSSGIGTWGVNWPSTYTWCVNLGMIPGYRGGVATAMNSDGTAVVGKFNLVGSPGSHAMVWTAAEGVSTVGTIQGLEFAELSAVTRSGALAGGRAGTDPSSAGIAMVWERGVGLMTAEEYVAARGVVVTHPLSSIEGMSADGRVIVGWSGCCNGYVIELPGCGSADFDGDGDTATDADIEAFFRCLAGECCAACWSGGADFDGDGDTATDADIESFFRVLAGGGC